MASYVILHVNHKNILTCCSYPGIRDINLHRWSFSNTRLILLVKWAFFRWTVFTEHPIITSLLPLSYQKDITRTTFIYNSSDKGLTKPECSHSSSKKTIISRTIKRNHRTTLPNKYVRCFSFWSTCTSPITHSVS